MMNYFKHTNGEAFTLDSIDYIGYFHILDGNAYTEKRPSIDSLLLTPKNNIITEIFTTEQFLNTNYSKIEQISPYYINSQTVLDKNGVDYIAEGVDSNNVKCFKDLILGNPTVYKFEENSGFFYGLSSNNESNFDNIPVKYNYRGYCDTFSKSNNWAALDQIHTGIISVDYQENFKYLCSNGETTYTFSGNFNNKIPLKLENIYNNIEYVEGSRGYENPDFIYHIYQDFSNNKIIYVKSSTIEIHDATTFPVCDSTTLIDILPLKKSKIIFIKWNTPDIKYSKLSTKWDKKYYIDNPNRPETIKFGYNLRTEVDKVNNVLTLKNKYSKDVIYEIPLSNYSILNVIGIDIRSIDDYVILLHANNDGSMMVSQFEPSDLSTLKQNRLESILLSASDYKIMFSDYDSDVFITSNEFEYQTRFLSNPEYPSGRLETCDLMYYTPKVWNGTIELWDYMKRNWDNSSNYANSYYNLASSTFINNNKMYMILHNIGRIYAISQPMNDRFLYPIPLDLKKNFNGVNCLQSSVGLQLNIIIRNLIDDTLSILKNSKNTFLINERDVIYKQLGDYTLMLENMYINGNESINVIALQRILGTIFDLQSRIIPKTSYVDVIRVDDTPTTTPDTPIIDDSGDTIDVIDKSVTTSLWTTEITPYLPLYPTNNAPSEFKSGFDPTLQYNTDVTSGYSGIDAYSPPLTEVINYEVRNWSANNKLGYAMWANGIPVVTVNYDHINKTMLWSNKNPTLTLVRGKMYTFDFNFKEPYQPMIFSTNIFDSDGKIITQAAQNVLRGVGVSVVKGDVITQWPIPKKPNSSVTLVDNPNVGYNPTNKISSGSLEVRSTKNGIMVIRPSFSTPDTIYYISLASPLTMWGKIMVVNS